MYDPPSNTPLGLDAHRVRDVLDDRETLIAGAHVKHPLAGALLEEEGHRGPPDRLDAARRLSSPALEAGAVQAQALSVGEVGGHLDVLDGDRALARVAVAAAAFAERRPVVWASPERAGSELRLHGGQTIRVLRRPRHWTQM